MKNRFASTKYVVSFGGNKPFIGDLGSSISFCFRLKDKSRLKVEPLEGEIITAYSYKAQNENENVYFQFVDIFYEKQNTHFNLHDILVCEKTGVIVSPVKYFGWRFVGFPKYTRIPCSNGLMLN